MDTPPLPAARRRSLVCETIEILRGRVENGTWRVGDRIPPEAALAEALGVGRNTVREAVRVLSRSEMLEVRQGDGTYVRRAVDPAETMERLNRADLLDSIALHQLLEAEIARCAAERRSEADLAALREALAARGDYRPGDDRAAFHARDRAFHRCVAAAAHNDALDALYRYFASSMEVRLHESFSEGELAEPTLAEHAAIVDAIAAGNGEAAAAAARAVLAAQLERLRRSRGA